MGLGKLQGTFERADFSQGSGRYTTNMTFRVVLERDPETGDYSAVCPELPGCASAGETEHEAQVNIREAIKLHLAREVGEAIPLL